MVEYCFGFIEWNFFEWLLDARLALGGGLPKGRIVEALQLVLSILLERSVVAEFLHRKKSHIYRECGYPHEDVLGLDMSRAFGDFMLKNYGIISKPDVSYHHISPNGQFLVVATDGVWDVLSNDQVVSIVCAANNASAASEAAVKVSLDAGNRSFQTAREMTALSSACSFNNMFLRQIVLELRL